MEFEQRYKLYQRAAEEYLSGCFANQTPWADLYQSMRYSLLSGGKRVRPVLTLEFARLTANQENHANQDQDQERELLSGWRRAVPVACALEFVHTYSLIHDDLPCMDNDDFRRGRPTNHKKYGETMAILAGDALQAEAYKIILTAPGLEAAQKAECALILSKASGASGMVAGQVLDTLHETRGQEELTRVHELKTGAMIAGACELGAVCGGLSGGKTSLENQIRRDTARNYGHALGMAFQIRDDLLDVIGDAEAFGKPIGSDSQQGKITFVDLLGVAGCEREIEKYTNQAIESVKDLDQDGFLTQLARNLAERVK